MSSDEFFFFVILLISLETHFIWRTEKQIAQTFNEYARCQSIHDKRNDLNIQLFSVFIVNYPELHITITMH